MLRIVEAAQYQQYEIVGIDGVQAVQLALLFAGSQLDRLAGLGGVYILEDGEIQDHGFGRLDEAPPERSAMAKSSTSTTTAASSA